MSWVLLCRQSVFHRVEKLVLNTQPTACTHLHTHTHLQMLMELRLSHKTVGYHQKLTSLSLPALLPPPPSLLPTSVCLSLSSRHPTTTGCLYTIMAIGSFLSFPYVLCRIWSWYSSCKNTLSQRKEPCNVNIFKRPTSTLFLCLLAVRIFFTRCCWFNIYRCHGTQKVMTEELWSSCCFAMCLGVNADCSHVSPAWELRQRTPLPPGVVRWLPPWYPALSPVISSFTPPAWPCTT